MQIMPLFASPMGWDPLDIDLQSIEDYCYQQYNKSSVPNKEHGWQSGFLDLSSKELAPLINEVKLKLSEANYLYQIKEDHALELSNGWININKPQGMSMQNNVMHLHPGRFISFVFYVKASPNCGNLKLLSPLYSSVGFAVPSQIFEEFNIFNSSSWIVSPEAGRLLMLPSWIMHQADSNQSDSDRISIAFNAELKNLNKVLNP